jgi:hypothetical protein
MIMETEEQMNSEVFAPCADYVLVTNTLSFIKSTPEIDQSKTMDSKSSTPPKERPAPTESLAATQIVRFADAIESCFVANKN